MNTSKDSEPQQLQPVSISTSKNPTLSSERLNIPKKVILAYVLVNLVAFFGFGSMSMLPACYLYISQDLGMGPLQLGMLSVGSTVTQALAALVWGPILKKIGNPCLLLGTTRLDCCCCLKIGVSHVCIA